MAHSLPDAVRSSHQSDTMTNGLFHSTMIYRGIPASDTIPQKYASGLLQQPRQKDMTESSNLNLPQQFASDNYSGICPEAWHAMDRANRGHAAAYGDDPWTARAADAFRDLFETDCEVFFAFNGTAANSLALASLCQSYHGVICSQYAHVETDECGAPEFFSNGSKLFVAESPDGKLSPAAIADIASNSMFVHDFHPSQSRNRHSYISWGRNTDKI